jgi:hypothetical protein
MVNLRILKFEKLTFQNIFKILFMNNVRRCFYSFYKRPIFVAVEKKTCQITFTDQAMKPLEILVNKDAGELSQLLFCF